MSKPSKKLRKEAANLVRLATKVLDYRRDLMPAESVQDIEAQRDALAGMLSDKAQPPRPESIQKAMARLDAALKPHGGNIYPVTFISENIEMLLVAAILAIGFRTFFLQPFKIPTNSMWPTYAGMTETVYNIDEGGPNTLEKVWHFVTLGAINFQQPAPVSGEVLIPMGVGEDELGPKAVIPSEEFMGRKWFGLLPAPKRRYVIFVAGKPVVFEVPSDFRLDDVIHQTYFSDYPTLYDAYSKAKSEGRVAHNERGMQAVVTGKTLEAGQSVLDFDIDTGDMLFVDRFSYNFVRPKVGDPIVFRTQKIPGLANPSTGAPSENYYIKRLVGLSGDTLEVKAPALYRNGELIQGAEAFQKNADRVDGYPGYTPAWRLRPGQTDTVPDGYIYAMGDNSPESYDSRGWGFMLPQQNPEMAKVPNLNYVPEKEVIGDAFFIFYPFTKRWGLAE